MPKYTVARYFRTFCKSHKAAVKIGKKMDKLVKAATKNPTSQVIRDRIRRLRTRSTKQQDRYLKRQQRIWKHLNEEKRAQIRKYPWYDQPKLCKRKKSSS
jgi:hypothetical protein